jgi:hypothetical protein
MKTNKKIEIFELYNPSHPTQKKKKKGKGNIPRKSEN